MNVTTMVQGRPLNRRLLSVLAAPLLVLGLAACDTNRGGFSQEDAAAIRDQIEQVADRLDAVEQRLMDLSAEGGQGGPERLISEVREVRDDVGEARNMLTEVSQQLADEQAEESLEEPFPGDPLAPPVDDPLAPPADDGMGVPPIGDDLNRLGEDVEQGIDDLGQDVREGAQDLQVGAEDALDGVQGDDPVDDPLDDPLNEGPNDQAPLDDPLVPNPPDL